MYSILNHFDPAQLKKELEKERKSLAVAFHRGKSMSELKELVTKIRMLEAKLKSASLFFSNN